MIKHPLVDAGSTILSRAIELENHKRLTESFVCFQEGIGLLLKALRALPEETDKEFKLHLRKRIFEYMDKAENLKLDIKRETAGGKYHEQIVITEGSTGFGYQRIFGRFLSDGTVREVWVEDPYVRNSFQIENFCHFCEVLVRSESPVKKIHLITGAHNQKSSEQREKFQWLKEDLQRHQVAFDWSISDTLHDREIRFDNGWIVKIGRGLDYIRRSEHNFCGLGVHDYDFRPCSATTIDMFHRSNLRLENK